MNHFNKVAAVWDANSVHWERSKAIATDIQMLLPLSKEWRVLEYGAGTGILSFMLKDAVKEICMMDSSEEMVKVMQQKVADSGDHNLSPTLFDLEKQPYSGATFDLLATQMALHHIMDIPTIIDRFYTILNDNGYIAIADLYTEDGSFHGKDFTVHKGFDPQEIANMLVAAGFKDPQYKQCFVINKQIESGAMSPFPVFLLIAQK
ncbi:MAG: yafE [Bacteroidetes bacterium]|nr:yafE [Bacteroidota bacterium]